MAWVVRGLVDGIVTTPYPRRPDGYGDGFKGAVSLTAPGPGHPAQGDGPGQVAGDRSQPETGSGRPLAEVCPTGAITEDGPGLRVDRGACILCGRCVAARPDLLCFSPSAETASLTRQGLVVPPLGEDEESLARARAALAGRVRALRRSVHVRHVDAGSDGSEEWEVAALLNPVYDVHRLGIFFTASPRHADLLLVTGAGTAGMAGPLQCTYDAMPSPKIVLAAGTDAISGGLVHPTYATRGGVGSAVPVDVWVPGSPPSPFGLLHAILVGVDILARAGGRAAGRGRPGPGPGS